MKDSLMKWSMKGTLGVQYYSFNRQFQLHQKQQFLDSFFTDPMVYGSLIYNQVPLGKPASVTFQSIPCTILSMDFFDRILNPNNNIVRCDGKSITQCLEDDVEGFSIDDNLRSMILNRDSKFFNLYSDSDRRQFLWRIFTHFCLGGEYCQHEFEVQPYLTAAKSLYKELVSVERIGDSNELVIRSVVMKVQTFDDHGRPLVPYKADNLQNFMYLVVDPFKRSVAVLSHSYGGHFCV
ncbi:cilia- and flagella-associated protein 300-like [Macrosteles quadrilineatus]|uniref:cilia- and flagella-associated protein 300-like n=1 Tax=Macrosteles quadrilineatus TaxID=74068 RepID=UPI0023E30195|nr:cilia- and flagella-associated protein 300-like [Macrosteles quadrilineatus]